MPMYSYQRPNGNIVVLKLTMAECANEIRMKGEKLIRRMDLDIGGARSKSGCDLWRKHESDALAVTPNAVPDAIREAAEHGVPTDYRSDGTPVITSKRHKMRLTRALGFNWTGE